MRHAVLFLLASWVATTPCLAAQRQLTLEVLVRQSTEIVVGEVESIRASWGEWPGVGRIVVSDITLRVDESWLRSPADGEATPSSHLVVRVPGGTLADGRQVQVSEMPKFSVGERVLVFARKQGAHHWVTGHAQGKAHVQGRRVVGIPGHAIDRDVLTPTLRRRVARILEQKPTCER
ncbi:MAG: hypothetical protein KDC38_07270 [Planctomycetes bacterium]|nr:hypothetical protein [Planctomycetota bacterium]